MNPKPKEDQQKKTNEYLKYSGMAMEMAVLIGLGLFAGKYLDSHFGLEKPWMAILGSLLGVMVFLYRLIKDTSK